MTRPALAHGVDLDELAREAIDAMSVLYPLPRSITGDGVRETLGWVAGHLDLAVTEVPSGSAAFDWTIPQEWRVREAWLRGPGGELVADFAQSNLSIVGYSRPVRTTMSLAELTPHLHSLPDRPDLVPYRTGYYSEGWGFCLPHRVASALPDGDYEVCIDSELFDGSLTFGEVVIPGERQDEILLSTHVCHPSLVNDNLTGITVQTLVGRLLARSPRQFTYRLVYVPSTIGAIAWLHANRADVVARTRAGVVLTGLGDSGDLRYKRSRRGDTVSDRAFETVLAERGTGTLMDFYPYGYDERQYCSPGFDLPVGRLSRSLHGEYPEYHTSADDLSFVSRRSIAEAIDVLCQALDVMDRDLCHRNLEPYGEPRLGVRGLYSSIGGALDRRSYESGLLWVLSHADGSTPLTEIARRAGLPFADVAAAADALTEVGLLDEGPAPTPM